MKVRTCQLYPDETVRLNDSTGVAYHLRLVDGDNKRALGWGKLTRSYVSVPARLKPSKNLVLALEHIIFTVPRSDIVRSLDPRADFIMIACPGPREIWKQMYVTVASSDKTT